MIEIPYILNLLDNINRMHKLLEKEFVPHKDENSNTLAVLAQAKSNLDQVYYHIKNQ